MSAAQFALATLRLLAVLVPVLITARRLRAAVVPGAGALAAVCEAVLAVSVLLVEAEVLGIAGALRSGPLIAVAVAVAVATHARTVLAARAETVLAARAGIALAARHGRRAGQAALARTAPSPATLSAAVAAVLVIAQWTLSSANSLGGGMFNFDTLWYHMPFAAGFAQSGSVTGIHFTQADPITAYYPANSELVHAVGIVLMHGDFLSPLINLIWLAVAALASWCVGRRWGLECHTLTAGLLILGLPVLSTTQPGEAFNDVPGLAMLICATALIAHADGRVGVLATAGLALGFAAGVKYTFLVPAFVMFLGAGLLARGRRVRTWVAVGVPLLLTSGWWYLRNLIDIANPLGVRLHLGPLTIPGPSSPITSALQATVISEVRHLSLWPSRFVPGLAHMLGPLWPVILIAYLVAVVAGLAAGDRTVRLIAAAAAASGIAYLVFPTGATNIEHGTVLFEVNLRYVTPALALALPLLPVVLRMWSGRAAALFAPACVVVLAAAQFERPLWPAQPGRHAAFLAGWGAIVVAGAAVRRREWPLSRSAVAGLAAPAVILAGVVAYAAQRHYYSRRYLVGTAPQPGLAAVYRWAQRIAGERIALYGALTQYPLYGARDTNRVVYLGQPAPHGGYRAIRTCRVWRETIDRAHYHYVVLTPIVQTGAVPVGWTIDDPAASVILHPASGTWVLRLSGPLNPGACG